MTTFSAVSMRDSTRPLFLIKYSGKENSSAINIFIDFSH